MEKRFYDISEIAEYLNVGVSTARKTVKQIPHSEKRIGKRCVYDILVIDRFFNHHDKVMIKNIS